MQKITPFLWFNDRSAEEAMNYYASVFKNSRIVEVRYNTEEVNVGPVGSVMFGTLEIEGQTFYLFDGGPASFHFNESISFVVGCKDQAEIDDLWEKLSADPESEACGWCKDRFGVRWQIVPHNLRELLGSHAAVQAMLGMKKLDMAGLAVAAGKP